MNPKTERFYYYCPGCRVKRKRQKAAEYHRHKRRYIAQGKAFYAKTRVEFLDMYGGVCQCCGHDKVEHLALDHVRGGGKADRRARSTIAILRDAVSRYQPEKYRILCHNCNAAIGIYGVCPHQDSSVLSVFENRSLSYNGRRYRQWRHRFLGRYGRSCSCCGTKDEWCLTLDHVNGGGREHRAKRAVIGVYIDACRTKNKKQYQVLCWNCNISKGSQTT